ncbi:MAG: double-strand break repair protein AddB [Rhodospirillales bacterium]|nr:double-strand break repair protein AddB [Rhodospirillales bacterium]
MPPPNVFTIAAGLPFVDVLAAGIRTRTGDEAAALAGVTVLVPTQRSRRSLAEAFLRQSRGQPLLLPRIIALGDMDEDEILFSGGFDDSLRVPEAASGLERQLLLTRLVLARDNASPDQAANLGLELARLLDQVHTERLSFDGLGSLTPDEFAEHWRETLEFLTILTELWPGLLKDKNAIDAAERRNRLFDAQGQAWAANPPPGPVIAAGSTGSIPATADLLAVIAQMEGGAVVLPGLDRDATTKAWAALEDHHPQYGLARLLTRFGIARPDVGDWQADGFDTITPARSRLINAALTPAGTLPPQLPDGAEIEAALEGVNRIPCPTPREEAAVIALIMRQTLETPEKTAALVTPDRGLARRVAAELARWNIDIDDSAGVPLAQTPPGAFIRLTARMVADEMAPASLLAALKHPLAAGGLPTVAFRASIRSLEIAILRGPRPAPGINGLLAAIDADRDLNKTKNRDKADQLRAFIHTLRGILQPLVDVMDGAPCTLADMVSAHIRMAEALADTGEGDGAALLWAGDAGEGAARFIADLRAHGGILDQITGADYSPLLDTLMAGRVVRPRFGRHPRLHIWGLMEARLQQADVMILGGLNEAAWPPEAKASPWMSRPMMAKFGLPAPERRIGLAAHDFTQAFAADQVVLTRSERVDGTPTVPSRWLLRLDNLLEKLGHKNAFAAPEPWLKWLEDIDRPEKSRAVTEPKPCPPVAARPRELPVTRIETWLRDPYAVYARNILRLRPLDPLDAEPGAAARGIIVHEALDRFHKAYPGDLPENAEQRLIEIGRGVFDQQLAHPGVRAFWWPRFERIAHWFIAYETDRRAAGFRTIAAEVQGTLTLPGKAGDFLLTARADRIDRIDAGPDIGLVVMDYKTGTAPTAPQVESGLTPQLSLEAAIARAGGFENIAAAPVAQLVYLRLPGGQPPGEEKVLKLDPEIVADDAVARLSGLIARFDDPKTAYLSSRRPMFLDRAGDYDHLARVKEWRGQSGDGE